MTNRKLGKAMPRDRNVNSVPKDAKIPSVTTRLPPICSLSALAHAGSIPRNRSSARHDLQAFAHPPRWQRIQLRKSHVEQMQLSARFAHEIGYPLNLCIDINWTRTWLGDDPDGYVLSRLMELSRKWLKPRYCAVFAQIAVCENPDGRPNAHILVHCPRAVLPQFKRQVRSVLRKACRRLEKDAVTFSLVGKGNATLEATLGKLRYMCKGTYPEDAIKCGIRPVPQGSTYCKPCSISQDIHRTARQRYECAEG